LNFVSEVTEAVVSKLIYFVVTQDKIRTEQNSKLKEYKQCVTCS